ncbi:MAG: cupin domain-containing protein [Prolixibacteraceae bacterium]|nr:cupin domain-containing protein [Prolixibacteraceae bacterium]MBN2773727.1 cupin domain-containing protein [Prolixibacteraceae bacterium]
MKLYSLITVVIFSLFMKDSGHIESKVYSFSDTPLQKTETGGKRQIIDGSTFHMENFEIHATTLNPGLAPHGSQVHTDEEEIIVVKEGKLKITIENESKILGPESAALILPCDEHALENAADVPTTYFIVKYKSRQPINMDRGKANGGSMLIDFNDITFIPHDKGGIRRYFDRKTPLSERIEMHVTTLNPNIKSHEPHTHEPAEIVLMMDGTTEMEIGEGIYPGKPGDIYFLGSDIPHAIRNTGSEPCMYMAFQWE